MYKRICNVTSRYHIFQACIYLCIANYFQKGVSQKPFATFPVSATAKQFCMCKISYTNYKFIIKYQNQFPEIKLCDMRVWSDIPAELIDISWSLELLSGKKAFHVSIQIYGAFVQMYLTLQSTGKYCCNPHTFCCQWNTLNNATWISPRVTCCDSSQ